MLEWNLRRRTPSTLASWVVAVFVAVQLATGVAVVTRHLGVVPLYGDTPGYVKSADTLQILALRGFVYPYLLAGAARVADTPRRPEYPGFRRSLDRDLDLVQILQLAVFAASLAYFLRAMSGASQAGPSRRIRFALLLALLWLDPIGLHYGLSILTDSLALSASLVFCAAFADLARGRLPGWIPAILLVSSAFIATGLRIEKGIVIVVTVGVSAAAYAWLVRRQVARRAIMAAAIGIAGVGLGQWAHMKLTEPPKIQFIDVFLTQRVVYPHLGDVYDELPETVRARLGRAEAERFDQNIQQARRVVEEVTGGDPKLRHAFLVDLARTVLGSKALAIGADVAKDTLENAFPTAAFHVRVGSLLALGDSVFQERFRGDGVRGAYVRMSLPLPLLFPAHLASSAALTVVACVASVTRFRRRPRNAGSGSEVAARWLPAAVFVLANAAAFALMQDLVQVRYALFAHTIFLAVVYDTMLRWLFAREVPENPASFSSSGQKV